MSDPEKPPLRKQPTFVDLGDSGMPVQRSTPVETERTLPKLLITKGDPVKIADQQSGKSFTLRKSSLQYPVMDRLLSTPRELVDYFELLDLCIRRGRRGDIMSTIGAIKRKLRQIFPEREMISQGLIGFTNNYPHYGFKLNADVEFIDPNTPNPPPADTTVFDTSRLAKVRLAPEKKSAVDPFFTHPTLQGDSVIEEWTTLSETIRPVSVNDAPSDMKLPDLSVVRDPHTRETEDGEDYPDPLFIRPDAWDDIVPADEDFRPDLDTDKWYRNLVKRFPVLSVIAQNDLVGKIKDGERARREFTAKGDAHSPTEEKQFGTTIKEAEEAREKLILHNLALVPYVLRKSFDLKRITNELDSPALNAMDIIQAGTKGIIKAINTYDISGEANFSTYAIGAIRLEIVGVFQKESRTIRLPLAIGIAAYNLRKKQDELTLELGRVATADDVAAALEKPVKKVRDLLALNELNNSLADTIGEPVEAINTQADPDAFELDPDNIPSPDQMDESTEELLIDQAEEEYFAKITSSVGMNEAVGDALSNLTERERQIVRRRFGFEGDGSRKTLQAIADEFDMTREGVRQIEVKALGKLRRASIANRLRGFVEES